MQSVQTSLLFLSNLARPWFLAKALKWEVSSSTSKFHILPAMLRCTKTRSCTSWAVWKSWSRGLQRLQLWYFYIVSSLHPKFVKHPECAKSASKRSTTTNPWIFATWRAAVAIRHVVTLGAACGSRWLSKVVCCDSGPWNPGRSNISHTFCKRSLCTSHRATQELPKNASSGASIFGAWAFALDSSSVSSFLSNRLKIPSSSKALAFFLFTGALLLFGTRIWVAGRTGSQKPLDQEHQERPQTEAQTTSKQSKQPTFWREQPSNDGETFWVMVKSLCQIMSEWPLFPWWFRLWNASHLAPFPEMKAKSATWKKLEAVTSCYSGFSATHRYTPYIIIYIYIYIRDRMRLY